MRFSCVGLVGIVGKDAGESRRAGGAAAPEDDLGGGDREAALAVDGRHDREVGVDVDDAAARVAHHVVVRLDGGVEAGRAGAEVERVELAHGGQVVEGLVRSEEHTSELQSLMRISYAVFCLNKKIK